jgi:serine/threonine-protein kinase RsbW
MDGDYLLEGLAVPQTLHELHELLERAGSEHPDVLPEDLMRFETAVIEIAGNVVEHGRPKGEVTYTFALQVRPDRLEGVLDDGGQPVPPSHDSDMPDQWSEDGRGLPLAQAALDELTYEREDSRNLWRMVKHRR